MGAISDINDALCSAVATAFPGADIAWENKDFNPSDGSTFIEVFLRKTFTRQNMGVNAFIEHTGLFYMVINVPTGSAADTARTMADYANSVYYRGATLTSGSAQVRIEGFDVDPILPGQKAWAQLPCIVKWRCHVLP